MAFSFQRDIPTTSRDNAVESYYLETCDGLFFTVKGLEHPPDRLIAVVRYAPDPNGQRKKNGIRYRRLYDFDEQEQLLRSSYPHYLAYDPIFQATLQCVPKPRVQNLYDPCTRLRELSEGTPSVGIEADAAAFANLLSREAGILRTAIGISGSLLIGLHLNTSDLDLSIFGAGSCRKAYEALGRLRDAPSSCVNRLDGRGIEELYRQRVTGIPVPFDEFARLEGDKACQGLFHGRPYFIRFIKEPGEAGVRYGSSQYTPLGRATITATVSDNCDAIFTPCRYKVSNLCIIEGPSVPVGEIVSFRGRFCEQARVSEFVRASGTVERVDNRISNETGYRLLLGSFSEDTMQVVGK